MMAMDDGGFGALTITKPITVDGGRHHAGSLASGGINAINININPATAPANFVNNGRVLLKNLKLEGNTGIPSSGGFTLGLNGVRVIDARSVKLYNVDIGHFSRHGVLVDTANTTKVLVQNSDIHDNGGAGVMVAPGVGGNGSAVVRGSAIDDNTCGIVAAGFGVGTVFTTECGTNAAVGVPRLASVAARRNAIMDNSGSGILVRGASSGIGIGGNEVSRNGFGLRALDGAAINSFGDNQVSGNGTDGAPTGASVPLKSVAR
jgi:hypothetical protein